jgi:hypothetical protein
MADVGAGVVDFWIDGYEFLKRESNEASRGICGYSKASDRSWSFAVPLSIGCAEGFPIWSAISAIEGNAEGADVDAMLMGDLCLPEKFVQEVKDSVS